MSIRIAMWSGPRNISTAMMRAFENREDTTAVDEPFYACYLHSTGLDHPLGQGVINSQSTDWSVVAKAMSEQSFDEEIFYQKHMTHHMLRKIDLSWTRNLHNCFLIRDPEYVVNSYSKKMHTISQDAIGIKRQFELFTEISGLTDKELPVIDAGQFLQSPEEGLRKLCDKLSIPFSARMLSWPKGRRASDGVWASHWYESVEESTGFQPLTESKFELTPEQQAVADESAPYYQALLEKC